MEFSSDLQEWLAEYARGKARDANFQKVADHLSGLIYHAALRQGRD